MTKIRARVAAADGTSTLGINGPLILGVSRVLDQHAALAAVKASVPRGARREHAIHHVNAKRDVIGNLLGAADAHEIAWAVLRQQGGYFGGHLASDFVRLADSETADRVAGKIEIEKLSRAFAAQIGKRRALHDAELPLAEISVAPRAFLKIDTRAPGPFCCALQRDFRFFAGRRRFDAFVKHHGDVRAESELNFGGFLWRKEMLGAIEMGTETHAVVRYFSQFGKAEDLIAAGIGEDGARPGHEMMQAAKFANEFVPRAQIEMIGIRENNFRAELFERFIAQAFYGGLRAYRQEKRSLDGAVGRGQAAAAGA